MKNRGGDITMNFSYEEEIFLRENFKTDDKEKIIEQIEQMGADPELVDFKEELLKKLKQIDNDQWKMIIKRLHL